MEGITKRLFEELTQDATTAGEGPSATSVERNDDRRRPR